MITAVEWREQALIEDETIDALDLHGETIADKDAEGQVRGLASAGLRTRRED